MELRNKETGAIRPAEAREDGIYLYDETTERWWKYELDLLARSWEYVEPKSKIKDVWFNSVIADGHIVEIDYISDEEARKAVEKIKAWKRLKDAGFVFCGKGDCLDTIKFDYGTVGYNRQDFSLLFGGEDE